MIQLLSLANRTLMLIGVRTLFALLLVAVQLHVLRAMLRMIRSMQLPGEPARFSTMFLAGLFKIGDSHLYVNRGLGTTGPPIRINAPPEITHITLRTA